VLAKVISVDGPSSLLDSDLLDGQQGSFYTSASNLNAGNVPIARMPQIGTMTVLGNVTAGTTVPTAFPLFGTANTWTAAQTVPTPTASGHSTPKAYVDDLPIDVPANLTSWIGPASHPSLPAPPRIKAQGVERHIFEFANGTVQRSTSLGASDYTAVFTAAVQSGESVFVPNGSYPLRSAITLAGMDAPICLRGQGSGSKIQVWSGFTLISGALFHVHASAAVTTANIVTHVFRDLHFDAQARTAAGGGSGSGMSFIDVAFSKLRVENCVFLGGTTTPSGSAIGAGCMDSLISTHQCFQEEYLGCVFVGAYDSALYLSGDEADTEAGKLGEMDGVGALVDNCRFYRCSNAINLKRQQHDTTIRNCRIVECVNGVTSGITEGEPTGHGKKVIVENFKAKRTSAHPIIIQGSTGVSLRDIEIEDFAGELAGGGTVPIGGTQPAAVTLLSCPDWRIDNLLVRQTGNYEELVTVGGGPNALRVSTYADPPVPGPEYPYAFGSTGGIGTKMKCYGVGRAVLENGGVAGAATETKANYFAMTFNLAGRAAAFSDSVVHTESIYQGRLLTKTATVDVGSIAVGGWNNTSVVMTLTGVRPGDMIEGWSTSLSPQGLVMNPQVTADDTITFYLHNVSPLAIDVPLMTYRVNVRLSRTHIGA
jgi:hypothetical protein